MLETKEILAKIIRLELIHYTLGGKFHETELDGILDGKLIDNASGVGLPQPHKMVHRDGGSH
jgi:hypothetical protein